ncbi:MAG: alpha-glucuronidase, partial [Halanaerobiaceae bacterium]|nr:alpha-glucuronidase [Halanaerobiaceae bacterium]
MKRLKEKNDYDCWLGYYRLEDVQLVKKYQDIFADIAVTGKGPVIESIRRELKCGLKGMLGIEADIGTEIREKTKVFLMRADQEPVKELIQDEIDRLSEEGFLIKPAVYGGKDILIITGKTERGMLYGTFYLLGQIQMSNDIAQLNYLSNPSCPLRMINHWDNLDGSIERGYAGSSIFYRNNELTDNLKRIEDYARLLASTGINSVVINNVNVHREETRLISDRLGIVRTIADIFRAYGIVTFLSINYASPIELGGLPTADPLDEAVRSWWKEKAEEIYSIIPDFGGFLVKADSEHRPGPFTYNRNHADGANMLAEALEPFGGIVIWRAFVYNCLQDWRDQETDRAKAAYDNFMPLDGKFRDNVIIQIKNGPMDFQVREPVSPLFGGMKKTNQILELQITQEYTGQQKHLCYLIPQWKEILEFDTYARGSGSTVKKIVSGSVFPQKYYGFAGVVNVGSDYNWTGHTLAQANLYGYGRLAWNPELSAEEITDEWIRLTFGNEPELIKIISKILLVSWEVYEKYTSPLGIGWMVNPGHHYGPNVDGYEYSPWGTYHRADHFGIGVDRTVKTGTAFAGQYYPENVRIYESMEKCPEELLLFFHRVPYTYRLRSGKTLIQHIYDSHFEGVENVREMIRDWQKLKGMIAENTYNHVLERFEIQLEHSKEWRDVINS